MSFHTSDTKKFPRNAAGYVLKQPIGKGSQAVVWLARCLTTDEEVAIKIIDLMNCTSHIDGFRVSKQLLQTTLTSTTTERNSSNEPVQ